MTLLQLHAAAVCAWMGVIAAESVLELYPGDFATRRFVAAVHGWIDILAEGPLIALVVLTGASLLASGGPASPLLLVKVGCGLAAAMVNLLCMVFVRQRATATDDARIQTLSGRIRLTGLAIPFGLAALVIGYGYLAAR
jgi:hypothetical protein